MLKKGKVSKVELFYIENNSSSMSAEEIASDLGRSVALVKKHIKNEASSDGGPTVGSLMARKDDKGVVIMTENASTRADEIKRPNPVTNRKDIVTEIKKNV